MDPTVRIRDILAKLYDASEDAFKEIEDIAMQEVRRFPEDSEQGRGWKALGGLGLFSEAGQSRNNIRREIAALRGMLIYRQLDTSIKPRGADDDSARGG